MAEIKSFDFCIDYKNMKMANKIIGDLLAQDIKDVQATEKNKRGNRIVNSCDHNLSFVV